MLEVVARIAGYFDKGSLLLHCILTLPLFASIIWLVFPAIGIHPGLNYFSPGFDVFSSLFSEPGIVRSLSISFGSAMLATVASLLLALLIIVYLTPARLVSVCRPWLAYMMAVPHLTIILGLQFIISPSGWLVRLAAPVLDLTQPPAISTVPDAWNLGYMAVILVKETGFVLMLVIAQLDHLPVERFYKLGRSFGYSLPYIWIKIIIPQIYPRIRLGLWILFVYAATNVEIALFASPNSSPPFSVRVWEWFTDASLDTQFIASAGALLLFFLIAMCLAGFALFEKCMCVLAQGWLVNRKRGIELSEKFSLTAWYCLLALHLLPFICMFMWSVSMRWPFPELVPEAITFSFWGRQDLVGAFLNSLLIGTLVATFAVLCVVAFSELSRKVIQPWQVWMFYSPLIVPQIGLVFGVYISALLLGINGSVFGVVIGQLLFVLPYCFIVLSSSWKSFDTRYVAVASSLGHGYFSVLFRIKVPLLLRPLLFTWALAFAVSFGLYLPSLYLGEGRVMTMAIELVTLGSNFDRRLIGVLASWLALCPLIAFTLASVIPGLLFGRYKLEH